MQVTQWQSGSKLCPVPPGPWEGFPLIPTAQLADLGIISDPLRDTETPQPLAYALQSLEPSLAEQTH